LFQQMRGKAVPQRVRRHSFLDVGGLGRSVDGANARGRTPVCAWWCWKRRRSSAVAVSGDRPIKAAKARTLRM
jgi:hypothetical protein